MNFIWSTGEKYEKSYKDEKSKYIKREIKPKTKFDLEQIETQQVVGLKSNNYRDEANEKMTERYLITQTHQNPFLSENNYLQDLEIQNKFLIPRNVANTLNL